jgi:hypothetical protein
VGEHAALNKRCPLSCADRCGSLALLRIGEFADDLPSASSSSAARRSICACALRTLKV